jgi:hypothetical protein
MYRIKLEIVICKDYRENSSNSNSIQIPFFVILIPFIKG